MNPPKFDFKNKVTYNYRKFLTDKPGTKNHILEEKKKNLTCGINTPIDYEDKFKIHSEESVENKHSILIQTGDEFVSPFQDKLRKRNKRISLYISAPLKENITESKSIENNILNSQQVKCLRLKKAKTKENLCISKFLSYNCEKTKSFKYSHRITVDASKVRDDENSKVIENNGCFDKNQFENDGIHLNISSEIANKHIGLIDIWISLENGLDNKQTINLISIRLVNYIKEEIVNGHVFQNELFSSPLLNKTYSKIVKIILIFLVYIRYIVTDFPFEIGLKNSVKKIIYIISETLVNIGEMFILQKINRNKEVIKKEMIEKINKSCKGHKINRNLKANDIIFIMNKNNDTLTNHINSFSNEFFKTHHFKHINAACHQLIFNLNNYNLKSLSILLMETILFSALKNEEKIVKKGVRQSLPIINQIRVPFLPESKDNSRLTLVLDLDETLVHYFSTPTGGSFMIRPGVNEFLCSLSEQYEIIIFTASTKEYADLIINYIENSSILISHRLYRQHVTSTSNYSYKDLSKIGRDICKVIIIDNCAENFKQQPHNGLEIVTWENDMNDNQLLDLMRILKEISNSMVSDVREIIKRIKEEYFKSIQRKETRPYAKIDVRGLLQENRK